MIETETQDQAHVDPLKYSSIAYTKFLNNGEPQTPKQPIVEAPSHEALRTPSPQTDERDGIVRPSYLPAVPSAIDLDNAPEQVTAHPRGGFWRRIKEHPVRSAVIAAGVTALTAFGIADEKWLHTGITSTIASHLLPHATPPTDGLDPTPVQSPHTIIDGVDITKLQHDIPQNRPPILVR